METVVANKRRVSLALKKNRNAQLELTHGFSNASHLVPLPSADSKMSAVHEILSSTDSTHDKAHHLLHRVFQKESFRGNQLNIIMEVMNSRDCFVCMPTGGGKSLCFQLPALLSKGVTLVVSPLLALIHNQVHALQTLGITALALNSETGTKERTKIVTDLESPSPTCKLLYVTPELLATKGFRMILARMYQQNTIARLAIDEAHCVSEWGHDFRPTYRELSDFRPLCPTVPIIALTATATKRVRDDIIKVLGMMDPLVVAEPVRRTNLFYEVRIQDSVDNASTLIQSIRDLYKQFKSQRQCGIVYCLRKQTCEQVAYDLTREGIVAAAYHADVKLADRKRLQQEWIEGKVHVMVATISFGMGIDNPHVRFVIHWSLPKTMESFYQETGRAGRDGKQGKCILFYNDYERKQFAMILSHNAEENAQKDAEKEAVEQKKRHVQAKFRKQDQHNMDSFERVIKYCRAERCRHVDMALFFEGDPGTKQNTKPEIRQPCKTQCDICTKPEQAKLVRLSSYGGVSRSNTHARGFQRHEAPEDDAEFGWIDPNRGRKKQRFEEEDEEAPRADDPIYRTGFLSARQWAAQQEQRRESSNEEEEEENEEMARYNASMRASESTKKEKLDLFQGRAEFKKASAKQIQKSRVQSPERSHPRIPQLELSFRENCLNKIMSVFVTKHPNLELAAQEEQARQLEHEIAISSQNLIYYKSHMIAALQKLRS